MLKYAGALMMQGSTLKARDTDIFFCLFVSVDKYVQNYVDNGVHNYYKHLVFQNKIEVLRIWVYLELNSPEKLEGWQ